MASLPDLVLALVIPITGKCDVTVPHLISYDKYLKAQKIPGLSTEDIGILIYNATV
jgi:hypothetical protein